MQVFREIKPLRAYLDAKRAEQATIGLVPTMGALHEGHLSLVKGSVDDNDITVTSIFVNPVQFNNPGDLAHYPRTLEEDLAMLQRYKGQVVFHPSANEVYKQEPMITLGFGPLGKILEGQFRPGHFHGVGMVVAKLFNIVKPHRAYFGQKDLQQFAVIRRLVEDFSFDVELKCMPIIREPDGLALSSRNKRLDPDERQKAAKLYEALGIAHDLYRRRVSPDQVKKEVEGFFSKSDVALEYFEIVNASSLNPLQSTFANEPVALCIAAYVGEVRLIDNLIIR
ncbi:MAG: pantoate--beta-alanine ligase [Cytophagales bacterium]|nr:pantoate--beta-alanine ligase [Cytophagales bacterium]